jgi:hypothetical protein
MRGDPKVSGIVKKIYLKYSYRFVTLIPFQLLSVTVCSNPSASHTAGNVV